MSDPVKTTAERLKASVLGVTKDWAKQRKAEERHASARANRANLIRPRYHNFRSASFKVMERAYMAASANGTLPASARQVMYQARPLVQDLMGGQKLNDQYFCQNLLPAYIEENGADWDVTYDDRGHFTEPHTKHSIGLGTISVRNYLAEIGPLELEEPELSPAKVATCGPDGCFSAVLFVEKEGFLPLFEAVHFAERFDIAIKSTKGMSNTACRQLADEMCGAHGIPLLVLHDFDKSGFSILGTLGEDTARYSYLNRVEVIDLGLRLEDVNRLGLQPEGAFDKGDEYSRRANLRQNGATEKEIKFLLKQRVELNALPSDQLVAFIERKLKQHGIKKVVPPRETLVETFRLFKRSREVEQIIERELKKKKRANHGDAKVPTYLSERVQKYLKKHPQARWDDAIRDLVNERPRSTKKKNGGAR
jgi:hypothetical protein